MENNMAACFDSDLVLEEDAMVREVVDALIDTLPCCSGDGLPTNDLIYAETLASVLVNEGYRPRPQEIPPLMKIAVLLAKKGKESGIITLADLLGGESIAPRFLAMLESALVSEEMKKAHKVKRRKHL